LRTPPPPPLVAQIEILRKDKMVKENKNAKWKQQMLSSIESKNVKMASPNIEIANLKHVLMAWSPQKLGNGKCKGRMWH
jgi:hypothetical protein